MFGRNGSEAPRRERDGLLPRILPHDGDDPETHLTETGVEVADPPGSAWRPHSLAHEQANVIAGGRGTTGVGGAERAVRTGDLIHIPSGTPYGIENRSEEVLTYVSAETPALDWEAPYDAGSAEGVGRDG